MYMKLDGDWTIKLGAHYHDLRESSVQTKNITDVQMHPNYSPNSYQADIALIELASPAQLNNRLVKFAYQKKMCILLKERNAL